MNLFESILNEACNEEIKERVTMNTNAVFIGDICYALKDEIYKNVWGDQLDYKDGVIASGDEVYAVVGGTAYGDGEYTGSNGTKYGVDAGVIGVVNLNYKEDDETLESLRELGTVVEITSGKAIIYFQDNYGDFDITVYDGEGNQACHVSIPTGYEEDLTCQSCGSEISEWENNRYGGYCESCYRDSMYGSDEEEEEDFDEDDE